MADRINGDADQRRVSMMSDVDRKVMDAYTLAGEEIAAMFKCDLPRMTESELAQVLLRLRTPELQMLRSFLEAVTRDELDRRRSLIVVS